MMHEEADCRRLADALRRSRDILKGIVDAMPARVFWKDRDYAYLGCNAAFARDAGFASPEDLIGKNDFELVWKEQAELYRADDREVMESGRPKLLSEEPQTTADGNTVVRLTSKIPLRDSSGEIIGVLGTYMDITERKRAEETVGTLEKLESLGVLAGGIAHGFNNVLTVILGNLSVLQSRQRDDRESAALAQEAQDACEAARALSDQLLTFAKGGAPVAAPMDLEPVLREAAAAATKGARARCVFDLGDAPLRVSIDRIQISRVMQNLVLNAAEAMPEGGVISIRASFVESPAGASAPPPAGRCVRVEVEDQGPGIDPAHVTKVFDPYFSTKGAGRGLGLATCFSIMAKHGGSISTRLKPRSGAVFVLHFPAAAPAVLPSTAAEKASGTGSILVMEDDAPVALVLTRMIEHLGYRAAAVDRGEAAIDAYARALDEGAPFAAVILDLTVRKGLGGLETLRRLRALDPAVKALVSSGYANAPILAEHAANGFHAALVKPYRLEDIRAALRRVAGPPLPGKRDRSAS